MSHTNNQLVCEDSLGPILVAILGEEDAQRVLEFMCKFGDEYEEFVRLFLSIHTIIDASRQRSHSRIKSGFVFSSSGLVSATTIQFLR
ncbi:MAG: hypothetical protein OXF48_03005 [Bacteroidetes bacterium]|nr:hypothetical protein [Bacteroidota bacterium]